MRAAPSDRVRRVTRCGSLLLALLVLGTACAAARAEPAGGAPGLAVLDTSRAPVNGDWVVVSFHGEVRWRPLDGTAWDSLAVGQVVPAASEIGTGPDGTVTLVVGGDRLVMAADSRLILPARAPDQDQRLRHQYGRLRVDVESGRGRDVEVRTPLLSLGIKGTSFEVAVDRRQNTVLVLDGVVAVTPPDADRATELGPREGWRQPVAPGGVPERLQLASLPEPAGRRAPSRWHLPATEPLDATTPGWSLRPVGAASSPAAELGRAAEPARQSGTGWLDYRTALLTILLIAGGGLVILAVPALMLGQNLRAQWLSRPTGKGRRRRSLTHG